MPSLTVLGKPISTAEMSAAVPLVSQQFRVPSNKVDLLLQGVMLGVIFHAAIFTSVYVELWSDLGGSPGSLIATSSSWTKAQIEARYPNVYRFVYMGFQFTPVNLRRGTYYHLVLRAAGYTGDAATHIAWRHAYPDPQYTVSVPTPLEAVDAGKCPLEAALFAEEA